MHRNLETTRSSFFFASEVWTEHELQDLPWKQSDDGSKTLGSTLTTCSAASLIPCPEGSHTSGIARQSLPLSASTVGTPKINRETRNTNHCGKNKMVRMGTLWPNTTSTPMPKPEGLTSLGWWCVEDQWELKTCRCIDRILGSVRYHGGFLLFYFAGLRRNTTKPKVNRKKRNHGTLGGKRYPLLYVDKRKSL